MELLQANKVTHFGFEHRMYAIPLNTMLPGATYFSTNADSLSAKSYNEGQQFLLPHNGLEEGLYNAAHLPGEQSPLSAIGVDPPWR